MIANKLTFLKKLDKRQRDQTQNLTLKDHKFIHKNEQEARDLGLILLDEFEFEHAVYQVEDN